MICKMFQSYLSARATSSSECRMSQKDQSAFVTSWNDRTLFWETGHITTTSSSHRLTLYHRDILLNISHRHKHMNICDSSYNILISHDIIVTWDHMYDWFISDLSRSTMLCVRLTWMDITFHMILNLKCLVSCYWMINIWRANATPLQITMCHYLALLVAFNSDNGEEQILHLFLNQAIRRAKMYKHQSQSTNTIFSH